MFLIYYSILVFLLLLKDNLKIYLKIILSLLPVVLFLITLGILYKESKGYFQILNFIFRFKPIKLIEENFGVFGDSIASYICLAYVYGFFLLSITSVFDFRKIKARLSGLLIESDDYYYQTKMGLFKKIGLMLLYILPLFIMQITFDILRFQIPNLFDNFDNSLKNSDGLLNLDSYYTGIFDSWQFWFFLIVILFYLFLFAKKHYIGLPYVKATKTGTKHWPIILFIIMELLFSISFILKKLPVLEMDPDYVAPFSILGFKSIVFFILPYLLGAFNEELFFRYFLDEHIFLKSKPMPVLHSILCAIVFTMLHYSKGMYIVSLLPVFIFSICMYFIRRRYSRLYLNVILHFTSNMILLIPLYF